LYVDGSEVPVALTVDRLTESIRIPAPFRIGGRESLVAYRGLIDDVRVYNRMLSADEVFEVFNEAAAAGKSGQSAVSKGLVGRWTFDRGEPASIVDVSGKGHHGKLIPGDGTPVRVPLGGGAALKLSGKGGVDCGDAGDCDLHDRFSWAAWIRPEGKDSRTILAKMSNIAPYRGCDLLLHEGRLMVHLTSEYDADTIKLISKQPFPQGKWRHLAVTYDGTARAAGLKLYIDGKLEDVETPFDRLRGTIRTHVPLTIGCRSAGARFQGLIDDVHVVARTWSPEEVQELAQSRPSEPMKP
jgi:hypothetical protein